MTILTRYLLISLSRPFFISIAMVLFFMMSRRMVQLYTVVQDHPDAWSLTFEMIFYLVPHYLGMAIPLGFFIAVLLGMRRFSEDVEIDAMFSAGLSMSQLLRPILLLSIIFMSVTFVVFGWAKPHGRYQYRTLIHSPQLSSGFFLAAQDTFLKAGPYDFIISDLSRRQQRFGNLFAFKMRDDGVGVVVTAQAGEMIYYKKQDKSVLVLEKGVQFEFDTTSNSQKSGQTNIMTVARVTKPLLTSSRKLKRSRGKDERELTVTELFSALRTASSGSKISATAIRAELSDRLIRTLLILLSPLLAIPFAFSGRREKKSMPVGIALAIMFAYYAIVFGGRWSVSFGSVSPLVGQWIPFGGFVMLSLYLFNRMVFVHRRKTVPAPDGGGPVTTRKKG